MEWKVNSRETIYDLKYNDLGICIHKLYDLNEWFLSCHKLNIKDVHLNTEDFNEAVKQAQIIIMEKAMKIYDFAIDFARKVGDANEFSKY